MAYFIVSAWDGRTVQQHRVSAYSATDAIHRLYSTTAGLVATDVAAV